MSNGDLETAREALTASFNECSATIQSGEYKNFSGFEFESPVVVNVTEFLGGDLLSNIEECKNKWPYTPNPIIASSLTRNMADFSEELLGNVADLRVIFVINGDPALNYENKYNRVQANVIDIMRQRQTDLADPSRLSNLMVKQSQYINGMPIKSVQAYVIPKHSFRLDHDSDFLDKWAKKSGFMYSHLGSYSKEL